MPIYEFACEDCGETTSVLWRTDTRKSDIVCAACRRQNLTKIISRVSVHQDTASRLDNLDPKYDKLIDQTASKNPLSDPNRHLSKMRPFKNKKPLTE